MKKDQNFNAGLNKVLHEIPDDKKIQSMSFNELAIEISNCKKDAPRFFIIERELKKRLAQDQAAIYRPNMILSACIGLGGVILGAILHYLARRFG